MASKGYAIEKIVAREILDSRGNPTIEVEVQTRGGAAGQTAVPSGKSKGRYEATELRDGGRRYNGMGVLRAVRNVNEVIAPRLGGVDVRDQKGIDRTMIQLDGTENKSKLGANATLGVSVAAAKAAAASEGLPLYCYLGGEAATLLPVPFMNIINGGEHAGSKLDFQEHMVVPLGAGNVSEAVRMGAEVYQALRSILLKRYGQTSVNVGDEGGFSPPMERSSEALEAMMKAVEEMGYQKECRLGLDVAASSFYKGERGYLVEGKYISEGELVEVYRDLARTYPIVSIEDPLEEEAFEGFAEMTRSMSIQIIGDDLFVTNVKRLRLGIEKGAANCLLWKVNQVGTLTEALEAAELARKNGYAVQASHRSGDTEDAFVADLAVGIGTGQIKTGAPCRGERTSKYNRLMKIEEELGSRAQYPRGLKALTP